MRIFLDLIRYVMEYNSRLLENTFYSFVVLIRVLCILERYQCDQKYKQYLWSPSHFCLFTTISISLFCTVCQKLSQVLLKHLFCSQFESKFNLNGINYSKCLKYTNSLLELIFLVSLQFRGDKWKHEFSHFHRRPSHL